MKERLNKEKGITLIALVITIIVLLILSGVVITMLSGDNGIIKRAGNAKILTEVGTLREGISIKDMERKREKGYTTSKLMGSIVDVLGDNYKEYNEKYAIEAGKLVYKNKKFSEEDKKTLEENGVEKESKYYMIMNESTKTSKYSGYDNAITLKELQEKVTNKEFSGEEGKYNKAYIIEDLDLGATWDKEGNLLSGNQWIPITQIPYNTTLDGCDNEIFGMYVITGSKPLISTNNGLIKSIILNEKNYIKSNGSASGICYQNNSIISKCKNFTDIRGTGFLTAGICVINYGKILDCVNYGAISTQRCAAGISSCSETGSEIRNCINYGTISLAGGYNCGGIVAGSHITNPIKGTISHCINYGKINGKSGTGGIVGVAGYVSSTIEYCINFGDVSSGNEGNVGGIVGSLASGIKSIRNCYNTGAISGSNENIGGIIGTDAILDLDLCYNIGECFLKNVSYGRNIMPKESKNVKVIKSFYLGETIDDGTILDEEFMKSQEFVDMLNKDSEKGEDTGIYAMDTKGINDGYPILKWQLKN